MLAQMLHQRLRLVAARHLHTDEGMGFLRVLVAVVQFGDVAPAEQRNQLAAQPGIADGLRRKLDQWERDVRAPRLAPRELR